MSATYTAKTTLLLIDSKDQQVTLAKGAAFDPKAYKGIDVIEIKRLLANGGLAKREPAAEPAKETA
jgi:hypothetical protein